MHLGAARGGRGVLYNDRAGRGHRGEACAMVVKYGREGYRDGALGSGIRVGTLPARFRMTARQRLMMVYLGIAGFAVVLAFSQLLVPRLQFEGQPVTDGAGRVFEKRAFQAGGGDERFRAGIEVAPPGEEPLRGYVLVTRESWEALAEGDLIAVSYQVSRWGGKVRFHRREGLEPAGAIR